LFNKKLLVQQLTSHKNVMTYIQKYIKTFFSIISIFVFCSCCRAQIISGKLIDSNSNPIAFANIGLVGKDVGTVSDENGSFKLELKSENAKDTLKFSIIGFKSLEFVVSDFNRDHFGNFQEIKLDKSITTLNEITVKPKTFVSKTLGNTANSGSIIGGFESNDLGSEVGTVMKIKRAPTFIETVNFNIGQNKYDSVTFRVNIYKMENGVPTENILKEPIYATANNEQKILSVDLKKYNLVVDGDFLVSLEWIKDLKGRGLYFCGGLFNADSFSRKTSQGKWKKVETIGLGFNTVVTYEK
jgi:hypothetical protein